MEDYRRFRDSVWCETWSLTGGEVNVCLSTDRSEICDGRPDSLIIRLDIGNRKWGEILSQESLEETPK